MTVSTQDQQAEFDAWLRRDLARRHAAVLREPVPDFLLDLLRQDRDDGDAGHR